MDNILYLRERIGMNFEVDFGYKVEDGVAYYCAVIAKNGEVVEKVFEERAEDNSQYVNGMNAFSLASKAIFDYTEDTGYQVGNLTYRSVQQFLDNWVRKGKHKNYQKQINFINTQHGELGLESFSYVQQKGGREGKKNNLALAELHKNKGKKEKNVFDIVYSDEERDDGGIFNMLEGKEEKVTRSAEVIPFPFLSKEQ